MKRSLVRSSLIFQRVESQIKSICPQATDVQFVFKRVIGSQFKTKITVAIPSRNILVATKVSKHASKSIEMATRAILSQLKKIKTKKLAKRLARHSIVKFKEGESDRFNIA